MRLPAFTGNSDGAIAAQSTPSFVSCHYSAYPVGPAS
jgi:hypothetical protein